MRWKTSKIVELLANPSWTIEIEEPGGDYDSATLILSAKGAKRGHFLHIAGFICKGTREDENDFDIEMIYVTDGQDSRGGLFSEDLPTCLMYAHVVARLRKAKFSVVPTMEAYF
jgi:hypothetical protein